MVSHDVRLRPSFGFPGSGTLSHLFHQALVSAVRLFFTQLVHFVAGIDVNTLHLVWSIVSATTEPVLAGSAWDTEFQTMTVIAAAVVLPLLCAAALQAIVRQDAGGLLRTAFIKVPLALLFTGVVVELVSLGLQATDQACGALISDSGDPLRALFVTMTGALYLTSPSELAVNFLFLILAGLLAFLVWLELAVRSAAIAAATLFFPLALAGSAFPATAHWARRLGETVTALVLSKLAIVAALTLAIGALGEPHGGIASVVEGITLLGLAVIAPLSLARILPMVEAGAIAHLDGLGRSSLRTATSAAKAGANSWMNAAGGGAAGGSAAGGGAAGGAAAGVATLAGAGLNKGKQAAEGVLGATGPWEQGPPPAREMQTPAQAASPGSSHSAHSTGSGGPQGPGSAPATGSSHSADPASAAGSGGPQGPGTSGDGEAGGTP